MADVSKIKLPDNTEVVIKDSRITGIDSSPTESSTNIITSGAVYTAINSIDSIEYYTNNEIDTIINEN